MASFYGGRGRATWFPSSPDQLFPWGRGAGGSGSGSGERSSSSTLVQVMASRAPEPWVIRRDSLRAAEAAAREVALRVHPTQEAERRRQDVVSYLKRLLGSTFGFEVSLSLSLFSLSPATRVRLLLRRPRNASPRRVVFVLAPIFFR